MRQRPKAPAHVPPLSLCPQVLTFPIFFRVFLRVSASPRQSHSLNGVPQRGDGVQRGLAACDLTRRRGDAEKDAENTYENVKTRARGVSGDSGASRRGIRQRPMAPAHVPPLPPRSLSL